LASKGGEQTGCALAIVLLQVARGPGPYHHRVTTNDHAANTPEPTHAASTQPAEAQADQPHEQEAARLEKRDRVTALGMAPYGQREPGLMSLAHAASLYDEAADAAFQEQEAAFKAYAKAHPQASASERPTIFDTRPRVKVAGRVVLYRDSGKLIWMNIRDAQTESLQIAISMADCSTAGFALAKATDVGDVIVVEGPLMRTRKGETTVWATDMRPGTKCLVPPPAKFSGLQDQELRYRQRYVDLWSNPQTMSVFTLRSAVVAAIRAHLAGLGFMEVETPMLQAQAGGAAARPFITHLNALDIDLSLRIAPELYLKRLLVGGMTKVFEINRNFRNEGVDRSHNPEFTMLELYEAFGDCASVMDITEGVVRTAARTAALIREGQEGVELDADGLRIVLPFGELRIDYGRAFDRVSYGELFERGLGCSMDDHAAVMEQARQRGIKTVNEKGQAFDPVFVINELFETFAEPLIDPARPTWIIDYPAVLSPLTRPRADNPALAERADLFIAGMEIGPHYTELNDPDVQAARFREQLAGVDDEEQTFRTFDADFINALKVGMPPAGGMGMGIDRLMMLLADQRSIRDVVLFPFMRPV
jgi:lysyl-tRNA synthetase, class II